MDSETSKFIASDLVKVIGAIALAVTALWRYFRTEKQKQARSASDLITKLSMDDKNFAAMRMIDWDRGEFSVKVAGGWKTIKYNHDSPGSTDSFSVVEALRPHTDSTVFQPEEQIIRDVFDNYLSALERIEFLIHKKAIDAEYFKAYFNYWLQIGSKTKDVRGASAFQRALWTYIRKYEFENVPKLLQRYNLFIPNI
jgi:hypothetical protein